MITDHSAAANMEKRLFNIVHGVTKYEVHCLWAHLGALVDIWLIY